MKVPAFVKLWVKVQPFLGQFQLSCAKDASGVKSARVVKGPRVVLNILHF